MTHVLPPLPYEKSALEPHMSADTLTYHHDKHHAAYVNKLNTLIKGTEHENQSLEEIVASSFGNNSGIFNNAAQAWNHAFFWELMAPGARTPNGKVLELIEKNFGSFDAFAEKFVAAGSGQFGSGWVWLVADGESLEIMATPNAENPLANGKKALIACDVWEHSYYLDFQNRRPDYLASFLKNLVNWDFVNAQLG